MVFSIGRLTPLRSPSHANDQVSKPVAVRYGWKNFLVCNLANKARLPTSPFRTDDWTPPGLK
jgi:hypothetical protein